MRIDDYAFGELEINGRRYTSDLLICAGEIKANWWREEGHSLAMEDLDWVFAHDPDLLIIGTGKSGVMRVPIVVKQKLEEKGIELIDQPTEQAVQKFNQVQDSEQVVAAGFHLTC